MPSRAAGGRGEDGDIHNRDRRRRNRDDAGNLPAVTVARVYN